MKHTPAYLYCQACGVVLLTCRVTMSVSTYHPSSLVETALPLLPPLAEALTEEQHQQQLDEQQRQVKGIMQRLCRGSGFWHPLSR
jgi:hypothetical protein